MTVRIWERIRKNEAVELAQSLVRIPSITGQEGLAISYAVRDWLSARGLGAQLVPAGRDRASVVCEIGQGSPVFLLNAHLDTKWTQGMTIDPFAAEIQRGRLYGRGACDTKGAVAAMMVAAAALAETAGPKRGSLRLVFEVGEEGPDWAAEQLWEKGFLRADWAVVGEPSSRRIEIGNRGRLVGAIQTKGVSTHTATAEHGVNAIAEMARVIQELYVLPFLEVEDPLWGRPPMNVWNIKSKGWEATLPYECTAFFDTRLNPQTDPNTALKQIEEMLEELRREQPDMEVELLRGEIRLRLPAVYVEPTHPLVRRARLVLSEIAGEDVPIGANPAMTMAHVLITRGVPSIIYGPGSIVRAHTADEWVTIEEIERAARFYAALAERMLEWTS